MSRHTRERFKRSSTFAYGAITLFGGLFQILRLTDDFLTLWPLSSEAQTVPQPLDRNDSNLDTAQV